MIERILEHKKREGNKPDSVYTTKGVEAAIPLGSLSPNFSGDLLRRFCEEQNKASFDLALDRVYTSLTLIR